MKVFTLIILGLIFSVTTSWAQLKVSNTKRIAELKSGTTYVVMQNINTPEALEYIAIFKKYWTFSNLDFITIDDMPNYYNENNSFLTLSVLDHYYANSKGGVQYYLTCFELWMCDKGWVSKNKGLQVPFNKRDVIVQFVLDYDDRSRLTYSKNSSITFLDFYQPGEYDRYFKKYWTPGIAKNYIQQTTIALEDGKEIPYNLRITNTNELKALKHDTLYIPKWIPKHKNGQDLFNDYPYPYRLVNSEQLNDRILNSDKPVYYVLYKEGIGLRAFNVINSKTGAFVFTRYSAIIGYMRQDDLKGIAKEIE